MLPGLLADAVAWIDEELEAGLARLAPPHDGERRTSWAPFLAASPRLASLLDDPRIVAVGEATVGAGFSYVGGEGSLSVGQTPWHHDAWDELAGLRSVKVALYLEPLEAGTGALQVIPGSHRLGDRFAGDVHRALLGRPVAGPGAPPAPAVALPTRPGDVLVFDHRLLHGTHGGGPRRRQLALNLVRRCADEGDWRLLRRYLQIHAAPWGDRVAGDALETTGPPSRRAHLEQPLALEPYVAALRRSEAFRAARFEGAYRMYLGPGLDDFPLPEVAQEAAGASAAAARPESGTWPALHRLAAASRAREAARPVGALFTDPWAGALAGDEGRALAARADRDAPGLGDWLTLRSTVYDRFVTASARALAPPVQVVLVGAASDVRAARLDDEGLVVFEVDAPEALAARRAALSAAARPRVESPPVGREVAWEPGAGDLPEALVAAGLRLDAPALVVLEGLADVAPAAEVARLLVALGEALHPESLLALDYAAAAAADDDPGAASQAATAAFLRSLGVRWEPWSADPVPRLAGAGFRHVRRVSFDQAWLSLHGSFDPQRPQRDRRFLVLSRTPRDGV